MNSKNKKITLYFVANLVVTFASGILIYMAFCNLNTKELPHNSTLFVYSDNMSNNLAIYLIRILTITSIISYVLVVNLKLIRHRWEMKKWLNDFIRFWLAPFIFLIVVQENLSFFFVIGWFLVLGWVLSGKSILEILNDSE